MKFLEEMEKIQNLEENKMILIVRCLSFLVGIGKDAIISNLLFSLKLTCIKEGVCRVEIPLNAISKYVERLDEI